MSTRKKFSELPQGIMSKKTIIGELSGRKKTMNNKDFILKLYDSVDARSVEDLSEFLAEDVRFVLGNHDPIVGKAAVLDANQAFFSSINAMSHHIDNVWSQGEDVICHGQVDYVRLNGSEYSAGFATFLKLQDNKIIDYLIYADISDL